MPVRSYGGIPVDMQGPVVTETPFDGADPAIVSIIGSVVDTSSGTFGVLINLPNSEYRIPAGFRRRVICHDDPGIERGAQEGSGVRGAVAAGIPETAVRIP